MRRIRILCRDVVVYVPKPAMRLLAQAAGGLDYKRLIERIVDLALARHKRKELSAISYQLSEVLAGIEIPAGTSDS